MPRAACGRSSSASSHGSGVALLDSTTRARRGCALDQVARTAAHCCLRFVPPLIEVMRTLARRYTLKWVERIIPDPFDAMLREMLFAPELARSPAFVERLVDPFVRHGRDLELVRMLAHVIRNLAVGELIVAGDLGDRGPRIDKVIELLEAQPHVAITFGNHDADWMAACLGHPGGDRDGRAALAALPAARAARGGLRHLARAGARARARRVRRRSGRALRHARAMLDAGARAHAEGRRDAAVQARGRSCSRAHPSGSSSARTAPTQIDPKPGRSSSRAGLSAAGHAVPDGRLGAIRTSCRRPSRRVSRR